MAERLPAVLRERLYIRGELTFYDVPSREASVRTRLTFTERLHAATLNSCTRQIYSILQGQTELNGTFLRSSSSTDESRSYSNTTAIAKILIIDVGDLEDFMKLFYQSYLQAGRAR